MEATPAWHAGRSSCWGAGPDEVEAAVGEVLGAAEACEGEELPPADAPVSPALMGMTGRVDGERVAPSGPGAADAAPCEQEPQGAM